MSNPRPSEDLASVAKHAQSGPMSTVKIMRALFEADIGLKHIEGAVSSVLQQAMVLDGLAASMREDLSVDYKAEVEKLNRLIGTTQDNIARLSSVKTAAQLAQNYEVQCNPLVKAVRDLDNSRVAMYSDTEQLIKTLREAYQSLGDMLEASPRDPAAKEKIRLLAEELAKKHQDVKNTFEGKNIQTIRKNIATLHTEVERTTAANVAPGTGTGPAQPRTLE